MAGGASGAWHGSDKDLVRHLQRDFPALLDNEPSSSFTQTVVSDPGSSTDGITTMASDPKYITFSAYDVSKSDSQTIDTEVVKTSIGVSATWYAWEVQDRFNFSGNANAYIHAANQPNVPVSLDSLFRVITSLTSTHYTANWGFSYPFGFSLNPSSSNKTLTSVYDVAPDDTNYWTVAFSANNTLLSGGLGRFTHAAFQVYCSANVPNGSGGITVVTSTSTMDWTLTY